MVSADEDLKRGATITVMRDDRPVHGYVHAIGETALQYRVAGDGIGTTAVYVAKLAEEGITWARGHNVDICISLRAAYNLSSALQ